MKCSECEKLLYLFQELNDSERRALEEHLSECDACTKLLARIQGEQAGVKAVLKPVPEKFENENPFLTAKIIAAIQNKHARTESMIERFLPFMRFNVLRYSMAIISFILLVLFVAEVQPRQQVAIAIAYYKRTPITKTVQLNSVSFREKFRNSIKTNRPELAASFSFSECLKKCRGNAADSTCKECEKLFNQIKNEGI
jgi:hypothetical protein